MPLTSSSPPLLLSSLLPLAMRGIGALGHASEGIGAIGHSVCRGGHYISFFIEFVWKF